MDAELIPRERHSRADGYLVELYSTKNKDFKAVHSYMVSIAPGCSRAGHFHEKKTEVICPIEGSTLVTLLDRASGKRREIVLEPETGEYKMLRIPAGIAHLTTNPSKSAPSKIVVFADSSDLEDTHKFDFTKVKA